MVNFRPIIRWGAKSWEIKQKNRKFFDKRKFFFGGNRPKINVAFPRFFRLCQNDGFGKILEIFQKNIFGEIFDIF